MASPIELLRIDGERLDAQVEANLAGGELLRTMDGASTLTLEIHDPQGEILETGVLAKKASRVNGFTRAAWTRLGKVQCTLDGNFFRISGVSKTGSMLTLTFEDEIVALLRSHTRFVRSSRADGTRAQFVRRLLSTVKERDIHSWIPSIDKRQRIAKPEAALTKVGQPGIPSGSHVEVKGNRITKRQRELLNIILDVAAEENASERARLAMVCAAIEESSVTEKRNQGNPPSRYWGVFQGSMDKFKLTDTKEQARCFLKGGKGFQGGGAISVAKHLTKATPGFIALTVEGSLANFGGNIEKGEKFYNAHKAEAAAILEAYGEAGTNVTTRERYVYKAGIHGPPDNRQGANYWSSILDPLALEVNWRAFVANNVFFFLSDKDLIRAQTAMTIAEQPSKKDLARGVQYVGNIDFDWHYNKPVGEVTFTAPADRWLAYPGAVTVIEGLGPAEGRWLSWQFRQSLDSAEMDITLHRPSPPKPEPAPGVKTSRLSAPDDTLGGNGPGVRLLRWAKTQLGTTEGSAKQRRYATALGIPPGVVWCSIFVAYGLKTVAPEIDRPTNPAYSGAWLQWDGGERVGKNNVQPGDLVIFDKGDGGITDHVAIYAGNGKVIGGNQSNAVTKVPFDKGHCVGVVRIKS